jgi:hypothetical protein
MIYQVLEWPEILINTFRKKEAIDIFHKAQDEGRRPTLIEVDSNDITLVAIATLNSKWKCLEAGKKYDSRRDDHSLYGYANGGNNYKVLATSSN